MKKVWIVMSGDHWDGGGAINLVTESRAKAYRFAKRFEKRGYVRQGKKLYWQSASYAGDFVCVESHEVK